jgi:hypothetical protein
VKYRGLEKGLDILWEVNFHIDGDPGGHAYLCSWNSPSEGSLGMRMCPKPLEPREIPHELEGNKFRGTA